MDTERKFRLGIWRGLFYLTVALGLIMTWFRFSQGLESVTNLSDRYPWGLWVGFKLTGVGLAAGGFVITGMVSIFNLRHYQPIARPAIVTAFLGYMLFVSALLFDLGRPWSIWHPLVMWNPHSVMFEVAWCVTLYSTVLALEASSMVFERLRWERAARIQHAVTVPLVIAGVILSTLHQSSLGSLYLIVPAKLHAIWYSPLLPVLFFVSAISAGLAMIIIPSRLSQRVFRRGLDDSLLLDVGRLLVPALLIYGLLRVGDLWYRGVLLSAFDMGYESLLFVIEFVLGLVLPLALLAVRRWQGNLRVLNLASLLVVLGFVMHRFNVSVTGFEAAQGGHYIPAWQEMSISLMLVALCFGAFTLAVRYFNVYPARPADEAEPAVGREPRALTPRPTPPQRPGLLWKTGESPA